MSEWPRNQEFNRILIASAGPESIGTELTACTHSAPASNTWPSANIAYFIPFVVYQPFIAVMMSIYNGVAVSGNVDVGIYDDQGNKIVSKGSTAQAGTSSIQKFDITDTTLRPGAYFMACVLDNTTGTNYRWTGQGVAAAYGVYNMAAAFPLPTSATFSAPNGANGLSMMAVAGRTAI